MKAQVNVLLDTSIIELVEQKADQLGISRLDGFRTAIAEWVGQTHTAKPVLKEKHYAYANGVSLGVFATKEEAEEAKRNALRQMFYYVVRVNGGLLEFEVLDDPGEHEMYVEVQTFKYHAARRREWEETAANHSGKFKNTDAVWEKLREFFGEEADKAEKQGCVVSVVVA